MKMTKENRYLLTNQEFEKIRDLSEGYALAIEKIILNTHLPRLYEWKHPAISGFEKQISDELERDSPPPTLQEFFGEL